MAKTVLFTKKNEKHIREKTREANFGHVSLRCLEKTVGEVHLEELTASRAPDPAPDASFWLNHKHLKFDISELNSFLPSQI